MIETANGQEASEACAKLPSPEGMAGAWCGGAGREKGKHEVLERTRGPAPHPLKWAPSSCSKHAHTLWRQPAPGPCTPRKALTLTR